MKGARCPCSMKPAGEKGPPELCGGRRGSKPDSATCLHSHGPERIKDIEKAVPDNASTPAKFSELFGLFELFEIFKLFEPVELFELFEVFENF